MGRPLDESALVERARGGDDAAFGRLVREHQEVAFRIALVITDSRPDAEEIVQDAFVKAHRALGGYRRGAPFRPWLLAIVGNEARNRRRAVGRRRAADLRAAAEPLHAPPDPEEGALAGARRAALAAAVAELPEAERLTVVCRYFLELSELETAAALGVPAGTAKSRLARALGLLRERLEGAA